MSLDKLIDIDKPLWDQSTYIGRWKHFAFISDCRSIFVSDKKLWEAKQFCDDYKIGKIPPGTQKSDIIRAKQLRDSAFHPNTDQLITPIARLPCQLPASMFLTAIMLTFQKSTVGIVCVQVINQMHNAVINYTYRSDTMSENDQLTIRNAFLCAIVASSLATIGCRKILCRKGPTLARIVPFCAVSAGHFANLPIMRYNDISSGIPLYLKEPDDAFMKSKVAAVKGVTECIITRICMSVPCLLLIPIITEKFMPFCFSQRRPWSLFTLEISLCALCCMLAIPGGFALFPEIRSMNPQWLRLKPDEYEEFKRCMKEYVDKVYYNKGL